MNKHYLFVTNALFDKPTFVPINKNDHNIRSQGSNRNNYYKNMKKEQNTYWFPVKKCLRPKGVINQIIADKM